MTCKTTLPSWFKQQIPDQKKINDLKSCFRERGLRTVCESAHCPNMGQCWGRGVATFMISGNTCTRACRFCAVETGRPEKVDLREPREVASTVKKLGLRYVVITSVTRDDLHDGGAAHFAATIEEVRRMVPNIKVEVLVPEFSAKDNSLKTLAAVKPDVFGHNIETVRRLSPYIRPQADYQRSLSVLQRFKEFCPDSFIKSGLMVGFGEEDSEITESMNDLLSAGCEILTIGQYLRPSRQKRHLPVARYVSPREFVSYRQRGMDVGFKHVISGPLVRSSYIAEEGYQQCLASREAGRVNANHQG